MQVDIRAFAGVASEDAADEPRPKTTERPHEAKRVQPHVAQVLGALFALMNAGKRLDLIADFRVRRQVFGFDGTATESFRGFLLGGEVFALHPVVHEACGLEGNRMTELGIHVVFGGIV